MNDEGAEVPDEASRRNRRDGSDVDEVAQDSTAALLGRLEVRVHGAAALRGAALALSINRHVGPAAEVAASPYRMPAMGPRGPDEVAGAVISSILRGDEFEDALGRESRLRAIDAFDRAIELGRTMDLTVTRHCELLAAAHERRGLALKALGEEHQLREAVAAHDRAIALRRAIDPPAPRDLVNLVGSFVERANALRALLMPPALREAVASADTAISLAQSLDPATPNARTYLMRAYAARSAALQGLGAPEDLRAAISACDMAIGTCATAETDASDLAGAHEYRGAALHRLGTPDDLHEAIASYDRAIGLRRPWVRSSKELRRLANAWVSRADVLCSMGTPSALRQAVASCDRAIELLRELDLAVAEHRVAMARACRGRGDACLGLATMTGVIEATLSFREAIVLLGALDQPTEADRWDLAAVHMSLGMASRQLGTLAGFRGAIESCDRAIRLMQTPDMRVEPNRLRLAAAFVNRGSVHVDLGSQSDFSSAIASFDQAIALLQSESLERDDCRDTLARAHTGRGAGLVGLGTPGDLREAILSFDAAVGLLRARRHGSALSVALARAELGAAHALHALAPSARPRPLLPACLQAVATADDLPPGRLGSAETAIRAHGFVAFVALQSPDDAQPHSEHISLAHHHARSALQLARQSETLHGSALRELRTWALGIALQVAAADSTAAVIGLVETELDPERPTAAPDHAPLIETARQSLQALVEAPGHSAAAIRTQLQRLDAIEHLFHGDTLGAASRRAARAAAQPGGLDDAIGALRAHADRHPEDADAWLTLAGQVAQATQGWASQVEHPWLRALTLVASEIPHAGDAAVAKLQAALRWAVRLRLGDVARYDADSRDLMLQRCDMTRDWLVEVQQTYAGDLPAAARCFDGARQDLHDERIRWLEVFDLAQRDQLLKSLDERLGELLGHFEQALAPRLPWRWQRLCGELVQSLQHALAEAGSGPLAGATWSEEALTTLLRARLDQATAQWAATEYAEAEAAAEQAVGVLWSYLSERERHALVAGHRLRGEALLGPFAVIALAGAVEAALSQRLYLPARAAWSPGPDEPAAAVEPKSRRGHPVHDVAEFLAARKPVLTLGSLIGGLREVLTRAGPAASNAAQVAPAVTALMAQVAAWPAGAGLLAAGPAAQRERLHRLDQLASRRNRAAHVVEGEWSAEHADDAWDDVIGHGEHAFLRYFVAAHEGLAHPHQTA